MSKHVFVVISKKGGNWGKGDTLWSAINKAKVGRFEDFTIHLLTKNATSQIDGFDADDFDAIQVASRTGKIIKPETVNSREIASGYLMLLDSIV